MTEDTPPEYADEFALLADNAAEVGMDWAGPPPVERVSVDLGTGRRLSAIRWGAGEPEVVYLHGGAQNAHTWDTVVLATGRPALAVDLPGHGHSDWREDHDYSPRANAADVAVAVEELAGSAALVVGMSLGGLSALALADLRPDLVRRLVMVDVTPGVDHAKAEPIVEFISGPEVFSSFEEILERTVEFNPTRSVSSLRRGVLHNARPNPDRTWTWRWDPVRNWKLDAAADRPAGPDFADLWDAVDRLRVPLTLYRGDRSSSVVSDDDVAELVRRLPSAVVEVIHDAGHSIQGDQPLELAARLVALID